MTRSSPLVRKARSGNSLQELREAIERIVHLVPRSPKLMATLKRKKRLRLSVAAVATEAGISRTAIYQIYPEIVADIASRKSKRPVSRMTSAEELGTKLRQENAKLSQSVQDLISENATLLFRLSVADEKIKRLEQKRR